MTDFIWTDPKIYAETNNVNSEVMNKYQSENMRYLFKRPRGVVTLRDVGTFTISSSTLVPVSESSLRVFITLQKQADVMLAWSFEARHNSAANRIMTIDFLQDASTYLSSLTGTALTSGLQNLTVSDNASHMFVGNWLIPNLAAGTHFWDLYAAISGASFNVHTNPALQISVREV